MKIKWDMRKPYYKAINDENQEFMKSSRRTEETRYGHRSISIKILSELEFNCHFGDTYEDLLKSIEYQVNEPLNAKDCEFRSFIYNQISHISNGNERKFLIAKFERNNLKLVDLLNDNNAIINGYFNLNQLYEGESVWCF